MLGFASEKNPKGPDTGRLQSLHFDLSGSRLDLDLPMGNCSDVADSTSDLHVNIFDDDTFSDFSQPSADIYKTLLQRSYCFKGFLGQVAGRVQVQLYITKIRERVTNLFDQSTFPSILQYHLTRRFQDLNADIKGEYLKIVIPDKFDTMNINGVDWITYLIRMQGNPMPIYSTAISSNHCISLQFRYFSVHEDDEPWYIMAKGFENTIVNSLHLTLSQSQQQDKASSSVS